MLNHKQCDHIRLLTDLQIYVATMFPANREGPPGNNYRSQAEKATGSNGWFTAGDAYETSIERILSQGGEKKEMAMAALLWIFHSERPLKVDELCHSLAVEPGSTYFDPDNVPTIKTAKLLSRLSHRGQGSLDRMIDTLYAP